MQNSDDYPIPGYPSADAHIRAIRKRWDEIRAEYGEQIADESFRVWIESRAKSLTFWAGRRAKGKHNV